MRVIISAGGTGGHIYPALAIIKKIKKEDKTAEFLYIGTDNRMEKDLIPSFNIPYEQLHVTGLDRKNILNNFKTINNLLASIKKCKKSSLFCMKKTAFCYVFTPFLRCFEVI